MTSNSPNPARPGHAGRAKLAEMRVRRSEKKPELITGMVDGHDTGTGQFSGLAHGLDMRAVGGQVSQTPAGRSGADFADWREGGRNDTPLWAASKEGSDAQ